jgi:hypothetical protein
MCFEMEPPLQQEEESKFFFKILVCEAIGSAASPGLLCQPRVIIKMILEKQMECRLSGETSEDNCGEADGM